MDEESDRFLVAHLGSAQRSFDLKLTFQSVDDGLEVLLARAAYDCTLVFTAAHERTRIVRDDLPQPLA